MNRHLAVLLLVKNLCSRIGDRVKYSLPTTGLFSGSHKSLGYLLSIRQDWANAIRQFLFSSFYVQGNGGTDGQEKNFPKPHNPERRSKFHLNLFCEKCFSDSILLILLFRKSFYMENILCALGYLETCLTSTFQPLVSPTRAMPSPCVQVTALCSLRIKCPSPLPPGKNYCLTTGSIPFCVV